jgi:hypothetical protein
MPGCLVTRHPDGTVVKRGSRVKIDKRSALELAAQYGLPVPRVYDAGENNGETWAFPPEQAPIIPVLEGMERIVVSISRSWRHTPSLSSNVMLGQTRSSLSPGMNSMWMNDCRLYSPYSGCPYPDEATFNSSLYFDLIPTTPAPIRTALYKQIRNDHRIVFSHGDFAQHNILVQDGRVTGLVDWEYAGWYPEHWEYIKFFERPCEKGWKDCAEDIFPEAYYDELACHQAIIRWQYP